MRFQLQAISCIHFLAIVFLLAGCAVGPDYERPEVELPEGFRTSEGITSDESESGMDQLEIEDIIEDDRLLALVNEALGNNSDLEIAASRVLQYEALARLAASQRWPQLGIGGSWTRARVSELGPSSIPAGVDPIGDYTALALAVPAYELDFWGRVRRANQAAKARLLESQAARQIVMQTIVTQVMILYQEMVQLDRERDVTRRALGNRNKSLKLTQTREEGGVASLLDVRQAEALVETARANEIDVKRRTLQIENELSVLLGRNPGPIERRAVNYSPLSDQAAAVGLPSTLLERRPDIRAAEQRVIAANADIGRVKAAYFPNISITGAFGYESMELQDLFSKGAETWQFVPSVNLPIFTGGRRGADIDLAKATFEEAVANYRKTVQNAFREVSDALTGYRFFRELRIRQQAQVIAYKDATRLANLRYEGGVSDYFEVLYNEQNYFNSEIATIQAARNETIALIQLYQSLGGGVADEETANEKTGDEETAN